MIYFTSDLHLGYPNHTTGLERERLICSWLDSIQDDVEELYLLGDIFDFWYEYKRVIPKGYSRFMGRIAELCDRGIPVHFFTGNHDVWMFDYFPAELGVQVHSEPLIKEFNGKRFFLHHGDGLGKGDTGYRFMKRCFQSKTLQWMFATLLHPNFSQWIGNKWSRTSRSSKDYTHIFGNEDELITKFARQTLSSQHFDYFIFGHWHSPVVYPLSSGSSLVILGDWLESNTFASWDGSTLSLNRYSKNGIEVMGKK